MGRAMGIIMANVPQLEPIANAIAAEIKNNRGSSNAVGGIATDYASQVLPPLQGRGDAAKGHG